jgi:hypothetical protein
MFKNTVTISANAFFGNIKELLASGVEFEAEEIGESGKIKIYFN